MLLHENIFWTNLLKDSFVNMYTIKMYVRLAQCLTLQMTSPLMLHVLHTCQEVARAMVCVPARDLINFKPRPKLASFKTEQQAEICDKYNK